MLRNHTRGSTLLPESNSHSMRFARLVSACDRHHPDVDKLVGTAELDVLQLDYFRPSTTPVESNLWQTYAPGLLGQLRSLHKTLYLDPRLHVVTNAGDGNTVGCVEAVAEFFCAHDDANLPVTAIRGDNVLARLEEFVADGVELRDLATGKSLLETRRPLLAAQVELGAGPIATALDEGSRFVVAGCYDSAAPALGSAVSLLQWSWDQADTLAQVATIANFAGQVAGQIFEVDQAGKVSLASLPVGSEVEKRTFLKKASRPFLRTGTTDYSATGEWLLRLSYEAGFFSEALFECRGESAAILTPKLQESLRASNRLGSEVQFTTLQHSPPTESFLLRATCYSQNPRVCDKFVGDVAQVSVHFQKNHPPSPRSRSPQVPQSDGPRLVGTPPRVLRVVEPIWCPVPRDAITVSVDTRVAKEWK